MNVYDFDRTVYRGDSPVDYYMYCLPRHPKILLCIPKMIGVYFRYYLFKKGTKTEFKGKLYCFVKYCNPEKDLEGFWTAHRKKFKKFYTQSLKKDDVIVSASPDFILTPLEKILGVTVIASEVSPLDGATLSENCYYVEKVRRFREKFPEGEIDAFYSDSYSDEPLAKIARKAYIVKGEKILPWDFSKHKKKIHV